ncbi:hypothetical protein FKM82_026514 [Ascaphus truei]
MLLLLKRGIKAQRAPYSFSFLGFTDQVQDFGNGVSCLVRAPACSVGHECGSMEMAGHTLVQFLHTYLSLVRCTCKIVKGSHQR